MASRNINDLHPLLQQKAKEFIARCNRLGVYPYIYCTYRSGAEQDQLYSMGRTTKSTIGVTALRPLGKKVTNAKAGQSAHNYNMNGKPASKAWDACPQVAGALVWDEKHPHWKIMGKVAAEIGMNWYGKKGSPFFELCHFEMMQ